MKTISKKFNGLFGTSTVSGLAIVAVGISLILALTMGGTFTQFTTTVGASDDAQLARFGYEANDGANDVEFTTDGYAAIDLFDSAKTDATNTVATETIGDSNLMIAPGVYGSFQIELNGKKSDVDLDMAGTLVDVEAESGLATTDQFISYTFTYETGASVTADTPTLTNDNYKAKRQSPAQMAADLEAYLDSIELEKNKVGTVTVQWAWDDVAKFDYDDRLLGQKINNSAGDPEASTAVPKMTFYIKNVVNQIVTANPTFTSPTQNTPAEPAKTSDPNSTEFNTHNPIL